MHQKIFSSIIALFYIFFKWEGLHAKKGSNVSASYNFVVYKRRIIPDYRADVSNDSGLSKAKTTIKAI